MLRPCRPRFFRGRFHDILRSHIRDCARSILAAPAGNPVVI